MDNVTGEIFWNRKIELSQQQKRSTFANLLNKVAAKLKCCPIAYGEKETKHQAFS